MPFGLVNVPAIFQDGMKTIFTEILDRGLPIYINDFLSYSESNEKYTKIVMEVLRQLPEKKLIIAPDTYAWHACRVGFLGYIIYSGRMEMAQDMINTLLERPNIECK